MLQSIIYVILIHTLYVIVNKLLKILNLLKVLTSFNTDYISSNMCPLRLSVRTPGFHPGKRSSILLGDTTI